MQIFLHGRRTMVVDVESTDTVLSLKEKIHDREGIPPKYLLLTHAGKIMDDTRTLADYLIQRESTVEFRIRA